MALWKNNHQAEMLRGRCRGAGGGGLIFTFLVGQLLKTDDQGAGKTFGNNQAAISLSCDDMIAVKVFSRPRNASPKEREILLTPLNASQVLMRYVWASNLAILGLLKPLSFFSPFELRGSEVPDSEVPSKSSSKSSSISFSFPLAPRAKCHGRIASAGLLTNGRLPKDCRSNTATSPMSSFRQHRTVSHMSDWSCRPLRSLHVSHMSPRHHTGCVNPSPPSPPCVRHCVFLRFGLSPLPRCSQRFAPSIAEALEVSQ